jgi:hypothetical protein
MARLQVGFTGNYRGRGVLARIIGSGRVRFTPIDARIDPQREERVRALINELWELIRDLPPTRQTLGSIVEVAEIRPYAYIRED